MDIKGPVRSVYCKLAGEHDILDTDGNVVSADDINALLAVVDAAEGMVARKYWYKYTTYVCPVCWRERTNKERQYGRKPQKRNKRYVTILDRMCNCN